MNFNVDLFEKSEAKEFGDFETLELGGHEIVILGAKEYTSEFSGNTSLKVIVDISGNDPQAGFFKEQFDRNTNNDRKWSTSATRYLSLKDEQIAYLKGFITALENSNKGFKFNPKGTWDQLKNLKLAGQFGLEEYEDNEGNVKATIKLINFRSLDKLSEIQIPRVKLINGSYVTYEEYKESYQNKSISAKNIVSDVIEITDDMLPF